MFFRLCMNNYYNKGIHSDPKVSINCLAPGTFGLPLCAGRSAAAKMADRQGPEGSKTVHLGIFHCHIELQSYIEFISHFELISRIVCSCRVAVVTWLLEARCCASFLTLCQLLKPVTKGVPSEAMKNLCMFQYVGME